MTEQSRTECGHRNHFVSALFTRHTNYSLCTKHTNHSPNDAAEVPAFTPRAGASQNGGEIAATSGFPDRLQAMRGGRRSDLPEQVVTSVCMQLRAFASAPSRVWSRLVAFSRAILLFLCPGTFGRVLSYRVVSCRHSSSFLVISRHFSSFFVPIFFFGYGGQRAVATLAGQGGSSLLRIVPAWFPHRAPDVKNDMTLILSWLTVAAGPRLRSFMFSTIVLQNRGVCSSWRFYGAF